ncbi:MAG: TonB family protein [Candidatus Omnitrophota bacterium]
MKNNSSTSKKFFGILLAVSLIFSPCTFALDTSDEDLDVIKLYLGEIERISVSMPNRVAIGNPLVADVASVTENEIVLTPKGQGATSFTYWDIYGQHSYIIQVYAENLNLLRKRVEQILKDTDFNNLNLKVNEDEGKIFLSGQVTTAEDKEKLNKILDPLKDKLVNLIEAKDEKTSVELDVQILELSRDDLKNLGIDWFQYLNLQEEPSASANLGPATTNTVATTLATVGRWSQLVGPTAAGKAAFQLSRDAMAIRINTLITQGKGKILSRPKLTCLSGKEAEFLVGGEVPILSISTTGNTTTTSVTYKKYGITLKIKPQVTDNQGIKTVLTTEVSNVDYTRGITVAGTLTPEFTNRSASTELFLQEGETLFIAGLINDRQADAARKFPGFSDIPILSALFRSKRFERHETELVICIIPKIIRAQKEEPVTSNGPTAAPSKTIETSSNNMFNVPVNMQGYVSGIKKQILENATYPQSAQKLGLEGNVKISLHLVSTGRLQEVGILESSGHNALDSAAADLVQSLIYPPFPEDASIKDIWIDVPLVYRRS